MADQTNIEWADSTLGLWIGCTEVSPACHNCYAREWGKRFGVEWNAPPRRTADSTWAKIAGYQRSAAKFIAANGRPRRVFINSLSDFFDNQADPAWRAKACLEFELAPDVIWMLVTKRPQNVAAMVPAHWMKREGWPPNVWMLTTAENQREYDRRVAWLLTIPAKVLGISGEPLIGGIGPGHSISYSAHERASWAGSIIKRPLQPDAINRLSWFILGGESGKNARPMPPVIDMLGLVAQLRSAGVKVFVKQMSQADQPLTFRDRDCFPKGLKMKDHPTND